MEKSPTGTPWLPPSIVRWLLPIYLSLGGALYGVTLAVDPLAPYRGHLMVIYAMLSGLLGMASPGLRKPTALMLALCFALPAQASSSQQSVFEWGTPKQVHLLTADEPVALPFAPGVLLGVTFLGHDAAGASLSGQALQLATGSVALAKVGSRSLSLVVVLGAAQRVPGWGQTPGGVVYGAGAALDITTTPTVAVTLNAGALSLDGHWTGYGGLGLTWDWKGA